MPTNSRPDMGAYENPLGQPECNIPLYKGWNFISTCLDTEDYTLSSVLEPIKDLCKVVYAYDVNPGWRRYVYGDTSGNNDLHTIVAGKGYLVYMEDDINLPIAGNPLDDMSVNLYKGWNLVGYSSIEELSPETALESIKDKFISAYIYDGINDMWLNHMAEPLDFINDLDSFIPGRSYWINVSDKCTWTLPK